MIRGGDQKHFANLRLPAMPRPQPLWGGVLRLSNYLLPVKWRLPLGMCSMVKRPCECHQWRRCGRHCFSPAQEAMGLLTETPVHHGHEAPLHKQTRAPWTNMLGTKAGNKLVTINWTGEHRQSPVHCCGSHTCPTQPVPCSGMRPRKLPPSLSTEK